MADQKTHNNQIPPAISPGVFCWILLILFAVSLNQLSAQARLEVKENKKNFGSVKRGEIIKHQYEITNSGSQPLFITAAEVACSCTSVEFSKEPILPSKTTTITVIFNTATVYGRQDRVVLLKSNDPRGETKLRFKGNVSRE